MKEPHLTPQQLSDRWDGMIAVKTLANWRCEPLPKGPPFRKMGGRIFYALASVIAWEAENEYRSTHEYGRKIAA